MLAAVTAIVAVNGVSPTTFLAVIAGAIALLPKSPTADPKPKPEETQPQPINVDPGYSSPKRLYRSSELNRIKASLLASSSILVAGEEGSGKSQLATAISEQLLLDGFTVAFCEPATPKQMLVEIAEQLGLEARSLEGKALTGDKLQTAIAN